MKLFAALLLCSGLALFGSVALPIVSPLVHSWTTPQLLDPTAVSSNPNLYVVNVLGVSTADYSSPQTWFALPPAAEAPATPSSHIKYFTLSIPQLDMSDVPVEINGSDLKKNAIHFPQTALPGNFGNVVIFGHSALPQYYHPGNPQTIFNPLLKIKVGDEVKVSYDGVAYTYIVKSTREVDASEVSVLAQQYDRHELTLITCTPLGTYWHRFVARAELED